jgi:hypothetical protein
VLTPGLAWLDPALSDEIAHRSPLAQAWRRFARLHAFERRYEQAAQPFEWKFTREDLGLLMNRLGAEDDLRPAA